jgi:GGDEF domain-containing protein
VGTDSELATQYAASVVDKIRSALCADYLLGNTHHQGSASIGIRLFLGGDIDPDQILKDADAAMYEIKKNSVR